MGGADRFGMQMWRRQLTILGCGVLFLAHLSQQWCIPCPNENLSVDAFTNCDCPFGEFYDTATELCGNYSDCPPLNRSPDLSKWSPVLVDFFKDAMQDPRVRKMRMPFDAQLIVDTFRNGLERIRHKLPGWIAPIAAPVFLQRKDVIQECNEQPLCILWEVIKAQSNYSVAFEELKPVLGKVRNELSNMWTTLQQVADDCRYPNTCPILKAVFDIQSMLPNQYNNLKAVGSLVTKVAKYLVSDLHYYIPNGFSANRLN